MPYRGQQKQSVDVKNKFLQDVDGPTFHHLSNGPSLNRELSCSKITSVVREVRTFLIH